LSPGQFILTDVTLVPVIAALEAEVEPAEASDVAAAHGLFDYCEALPALLAVFWEFGLFFGSAGRPPLVNWSATIVAVFFVAVVAEVNGFLFLKRFYELTFLAFHAVFDFQHPTEVAQDGVNFPFVLVSQQVVNAAS
jgi:hypothetical protein